MVIIIIKNEPWRGDPGSVDTLTSLTNPCGSCELAPPLIEAQVVCTIATHKTWTSNEPHFPKKCRPSKATHSAGRVSANTRPHQLHWGDREMGTTISCTKCSQVAYVHANVLTMCAAILERKRWNSDMVASREMGGLSGGTILSGQASCSAS